MKAEPVFKEMVQPISFGSFGHVAYSCAGIDRYSDCMTPEMYLFLSRTNPTNS
jgi:hypothetical protein